MWAVIELNKKQYFVSEGHTYPVDRLGKTKGEIALDKVLLFSDGKEVKIGRPYLSGIKVKAEILGEKKSDKTIVYKYKRRKKYRKIQGHRQIYTLIKIEGKKSLPTKEKPKKASHPVKKAKPGSKKTKPARKIPRKK